MLRSSELADLFNPPAPGPDVGFRQGKVIAWDQSTGANTIDVAGSILTNVPMLNTGEAVALKAGHIVGLLTFGGSWFILGRITIPGDPDFASASLAFASARNTAINFSVPLAPTDFAVATITKPTWADQVAILVNVAASLQNTRAVIDFTYLEARAAGGGGGETVQGYAPNGDPSGNYWQASAAAYSVTINNPGPSIAVGARLHTSGAAWPTGSVNFVTVNALAFFRSSV